MGLIGVRTLVGVALLAQPHGLLAAVCGEPPDESVTIFARVLGARHLVEAAILWRWRTPTVAGIGAAVDAAHAVSAVALVATGHHRRPAIANVASAATFALFGAARARQLDRERGPLQTA